MILRQLVDECSSVHLILFSTLLILETLFFVSGKRGIKKARLLAFLNLSLVTLSRLHTQ